MCPHRPRAVLPRGRRAPAAADRAMVRGRRRGQRRADVHSGVWSLLLTPSAPQAQRVSKGAQEPPFPATQAGDAAEAANLLRGLANVQVLRARLSARVVAESLARMAQPCRVVVLYPARPRSTPPLATRSPS